MEAFRNIKSHWVSMEQSSTECECLLVSFGIENYHFCKSLSHRTLFAKFSMNFNVHRRTELDGIAGIKPDVTKKIVKFLLKIIQDEFCAFFVLKNSRDFQLKFPFLKFSLRLSRNFNKTCVS